MQSTLSGGQSLLDVVEIRTARLLRHVLYGLLGLTLLGIGLPFIAPISLETQIILGGIIGFGVLPTLVALRLLRRGQFQLAVVLAIATLIILGTVVVLGTGVDRSGAGLFIFAVPICFGGLLLSQRGALFATFTSIVAIIVVSILQVSQSPVIGFAAPQDMNIGGALGGFVVVALMVGLFTGWFGKELRQALGESSRRERELHTFQRDLEATVEQRTEQLQQALAVAEQRANEQQRLLAENAEQRDQIRELSLPLLRLSASTLVMPLIGALDSRRIVDLNEQALRGAERSEVRYLILDVTGVLVIDTQVASALLKVVQAAQLLGVRVGLAGIRPEVAQAIVGLGLDLNRLQTFTDIESALRHAP